MQTLGLVIVGLGNMGRNWLRVARASERFEVVAIVDPYLSESADIPRLARAVSELESIPFDAAVLASPTPTHAGLATALLRFGRPVLVEKPLAASYAECVALAQVARDGEARLAVGHVERFNPAVRALRGVIADGRIGEPIHVSTMRVGGYPLAVDAPNNVALDLAVHDLDLVRAMLGPLRIMACAQHETVHPGVCDTAEILLRAQNGASANIHVNWVTPGKIRTIHVTGSRGAARADLLAQTCTILGPGGVEVEVARAEPLALQIEAFARLVDGRGMGALCSAADASAAVLLAERAVGAPHREWI